MKLLRLDSERIISPVILVLGVFSSAQFSVKAEEPAPRQAARVDLKKLQGTWECVAMEREGDQVPPESFKGSTAVYEDDRSPSTAKARSSAGGS